MTISKPKFNALFSLIAFLALIFAGFVFVLNGLLKYPDNYFYMKLILAPVLLAIALVVLGKFIGALKVVKAGKGMLDVHFLISRKRVKIPLNEIKTWDEEVVSMKKNDYREVNILYGKNKILRLSNKENTDYQQVVKYLSQKVKTKAGN